MAKELAGKVSLVTGATRGIGRAIALRFAKLGASVIVNYSKSEKEAEEVYGIIRKNRGTVEKFKADVSNSSEVTSMVDFIIDKFGRINILVNNAGIFMEEIGRPTHLISEDEWERVVGVDLKGVFLCSKYVLAHMVEKKIQGRIINIFSTSGIAGTSSGSHYGAAKAGVDGLTKCMAKEYGKHGIIVNGIAPGVTETDFMKIYPAERQERWMRGSPLGRLGKPEDIANVAVFLATTSFVNGQTIIVDGGYFVR